MSYGGKELANAFRTVRKNTIQVAEDIPESSYNHSPAPDVRSVAHLLTHVAISTRIWLELNKNLQGLVRRREEALAEGVTDPDGKTVRTRFERILGAKEHEMHHRGQLMLIERQLGIVPHLTRQFNERVAQLRAVRA